MPGGNGTGPAGLGPMSGRGVGYCAGYGTPGYVNPAGKSGFFGGGRGAGGGRFGCRNMYYATGLPGWMRFGGAQSSKDDEIKFLKDRADYFKKSADEINGRLAELEKDSG